MDINTLWCEKYRPTSLDTLIISDDTRKMLEHFRDTKDIPHLLFVGTPGVGKTTVAKIIVNDILKCDYLYINASDENGIDTIRTKIVGFAQTKSFDGGLKVIILDEKDGASVEAQRGLRNTMEMYSDNTRFILTANYKHKIITPIQSRCQTLNFEHSIKDVAKHCFNILQKERISIPSDQISNFQTLVKANFPDFRRILNDLQKYSISGVLDIKYSSISDKFMEEIFQKLTKEDICDVRKFIITNESVFQSDYHNLMKSLLNYLYISNLESSKRRESMLIIAEYMYRHAFVSDIEINAFACMISLSKLLLS